MAGFDDDRFKRTIQFRRIFGKEEEVVQEAAEAAAVVSAT